MHNFHSDGGGHPTVSSQVGPHRSTGLRDALILNVFFEGSLISFARGFVHSIYLEVNDEGG
jgi:hypothetical protein